MTYKDKGSYDSLLPRMTVSMTCITVMSLMICITVSDTVIHVIDRHVSLSCHQWYVSLWHRHVWVMSHRWLSHVSHYESCHTDDWVMYHIITVTVIHIIDDAWHVSCITVMSSMICITVSFRESNIHTRGILWVFATPYHNDMYQCINDM